MRMGERKVPLEVASWGVLALISTLIVTTYGVCEFPITWRGYWFLDGIQSIIEINKTILTSRGQCVSSKGDKYLLEDRRESCLRCLSIHEKHKNVLQFKETMCERYETLENICALLTGDAPLNSLFRSDEKAKPTECPFKNLPLSFSYSKGNGECNSPMSMVDACAEDSKLIFRYQACPDIKGSESSVEVLTCLGFWKEGFLRYFIGKVYFSKTNKTEFRCFLYEKGVTGDKTTFYNLAQSGDQSCTGLVTAVDGANVMVLTPLQATRTKCRYPLWITDFPHWRSLDGTTTYVFFRKNGSLKIIGETEKFNKYPSYDSEYKIVCHSQVFQNGTALTAIIHLTKGCDTSYSCLGLYLRDTNVLEVLQSSVIQQTPEDVCSPENFEPENGDFVTLVPLRSAKTACPYSGMYKINAQRGTLHRTRTTDSSFTKSAADRPTIHPGDSTSPLTSMTPFFWFNISRPEFLPPDRRPTVPTIPNNDSLTPTSPHSPFPTPSGYPFTSTTERFISCDPGQYRSVEVGCSFSGETIEFIHNCDRQYNSMYFCHGHWIHKNISYLIVSPVIHSKYVDSKYYCFVWKPLLTNVDKSQESHDTLESLRLQVSAVARSCHRTITPGISGDLAMNLSIIKFCEKAQRNSRPRKQKGSIVVPSLLFLLVIPPLAYAAR